jgi:hypothetical protein
MPNIQATGMGYRSCQIEDRAGYKRLSPNVNQCDFQDFVSFFVVFSALPRSLGMSAFYINKNRLFRTLLLQAPFSGPLALLLLD